MTDIDASGDFAPLGFGFMRLPEIEREGQTVFDHEKICAMVDEFMAAGFTYFDTAYGYHNGNSERELKAALVDRYPRDAYTIATKLPAWLAKSEGHARHMFDKSLEKLGVEYVDYYLLHNLGGDLTAPFDEYGLWEYAAEKRAQGKIRHLGFSIHDKADALEQVLADHADIPIDFVQLQINYADWESVVVESRKCYEAARAHGLPVAIMEPVKGGSLVNLPPDAAALLRAANPQVSLASWALRFCASLPGVMVVLSGMSTIEQVRDNAATFREARPLDGAEYAALDRVRALLDGIDTVPCTDCRYCVKGCPEGVRIPAIMDSLNIMAVFDDMHRARENYVWNATGGEASRCIRCGACEDVCPQKIDIMDRLEHAAELFERRG